MFISEVLIRATASNSIKADLYHTIVIASKNGVLHIWKLGNGEINSVFQRRNFYEASYVKILSRLLSLIDHYIWICSGFNAVYNLYIQFEIVAYFLLGQGFGVRV